jgi:hypothetical protein
MSRLSVRATVALVVLLLSAACTGAEPNPEPPLRTLKPVEEISINQLGRLTPYSGLARSLEFGLPRARALVEGLRRERPSWLRYIRDVMVMSSSPSPSAPATALVQTGIFINEPGREVGRTICRSFLNREMKAVSVRAASRVKAFGPLLAGCSAE